MRNLLAVLLLALFVCGCSTPAPTSFNRSVIIAPGDTTSYVEANGQTNITATLFDEGSTVHLAVREAVWCHGNYTRIRCALDGRDGAWVAQSSAYPASIDLSAGGYTTNTSGDTLFITTTVQAQVAVPCETIPPTVLNWTLIRQ